jgi:RNA polymerase sigma-70 factor (sigma-E family)
MAWPCGKFLGLSRSKLSGRVRVLPGERADRRRLPVTFEEFAASRLHGVLAFAAVLTGQRATAEDIAQEVLIRAYARWDTIGGLDRPEFYVRKMVLNEFLSWRRRSLRMIPVGDAAIPADRIFDLADQYADRSALLAEIAKLPRRQRAVLVLRYYEDRSDAEIAELLGCRPGTVRAYASRALAALRVEMGPQPGNLASYRGSEA